MRYTNLHLTFDIKRDAVYWHYYLMMMMMMMMMMMTMKMMKRFCCSGLGQTQTDTDEK